MKKLLVIVISLIVLNQCSFIQHRQIVQKPYYRTLFETSVKVNDKYHLYNEKNELVGIVSTPTDTITVTNHNTLKNYLKENK